MFKRFKEDFYQNYPANYITMFCMKQIAKNIVSLTAKTALGYVKKPSEAQADRILQQIKDVDTCFEIIEDLNATRQEEFEKNKERREARKESRKKHGV